MSGSCTTYVASELMADGKVGLTVARRKADAAPLVARVLPCRRVSDGGIPRMAEDHRKADRHNHGHGNGDGEGDEHGDRDPYGDAEDGGGGVIP